MTKQEFPKHIYKEYVIKEKVIMGDTYYGAARVYRFLCFRWERMQMICTSPLYMTFRGSIFGEFWIPSKQDVETVILRQRERAESDYLWELRNNP